jgi:hypothetical protein
MSMPSRSSGVAAAFLLYLDRKPRKIRQDRHWTGDPSFVRDENYTYEMTLTQMTTNKTDT